MNPLLQHKNVQTKCSFVKENGKKCNSFVLKNSEYCYIHSPDISETEKRQTRSKGGKKQVLVCDNVIDTFNKPVKLNSPKDVSRFLGKLINEVLSNKMDLRLATGISYIANGLLKSLELTEIQQRIDAIEKNLNNFNHEK